MQNTKNNLQVVQGLVPMLIVDSIKSLLKQGQWRNMQGDEWIHLHNDVGFRN